MGVASQTGRCEAAAVRRSAGASVVDGELGGAVTAAAPSLPLCTDDLPPADIDAAFQYEPWRGNRSYCRLRIYRTSSAAVVVFTQQPGNPGMSITNWIEGLATQAVREYSLDPTRTVFVEHYPTAYYRQAKAHEPGGAESREESLGTVTFVWSGGAARSPKWTPLMIRDATGSNLTLARIDGRQALIVREAWEGKR